MLVMPLHRSARRLARRARQRGLTLVELMVGAAVGLFIVAAASLLVANQLNDTRALTLETQIAADMRATAEIVSRELRRAGHWNSARLSVWSEAATGVASNEYIQRSSPDTNGAVTNEVSLAYSRATRETDPGADDGVVTDDEVAGFRLVDDTIQAQLGDDNWQALTDPAVLRITRFDIALQQRAVPLPCPLPCPVGAANCPPSLMVRQYTISIAGTAVADPRVQRSVRVSVRPRNDAIIGACP